jgi:hypothetical protein
MSSGICSEMIESSVSWTSMGMIFTSAPKFENKSFSIFYLFQPAKMAEITNLITIVNCCAKNIFTKNADCFLLFEKKDLLLHVFSVINTSKYFEK